MTEFNTHERSNSPVWLICQINLLIKSAKQLSDTSLILYAALETRNLLELLELEILKTAVKGTDYAIFLREIKGKSGIQQMNKKYKSLKYRYQSFSSAASKAIFVEGHGLNKFDIKITEEHCKELSNYIHIYTRDTEELKFESEYIQLGIQRIEESLEYLLSNFFTVIDGGLTYGLFDFSSFPPYVKNEFNKWLESVDEDEDPLIERLTNINIKKHGGEKLKLKFD